MITNLLPYIYGIINLALGIYSFIIVFNIYKPKFKDEEKKINFERIIKKYAILIKVFSILLIINGSYNLITHDPNDYRIKPKNNNNQWTEKQIQNIINQCIEDAKNKGTYYNGLTDDYCECSIDKMVKALPLNKYMELENNPSKQERSEIIKPIIKDCLEEYQKKIDSILNLTKQLPK